MTLEALYDYAAENGIDVDRIDLNTLTAISIPGAIAINPKAIHNSKEEKTILAHELGHQLKNAFYNISSSPESKEIQECRADRWAIEMCVPFEEMKKAFQNGITEPWELAEHFTVTEDLINKALTLYAHKIYNL